MNDPKVFCAFALVTMCCLAAIFSFGIVLIVKADWIIAHTDVVATSAATALQPAYLAAAAAIGTAAVLG